MLLREGDQVLVEIEARDVGGRIGRIAHHQRGRLRDRMQHRALERVEEVRRRLRRHRADGAARHQEAEGVDRVARVRHQHDVARRGDRLRHVGEALLGAERGDDLGLRVELHAEAALVIGGLRPAQARNAARGRIAVGARLAQRLLQLVDDMGGRRQVRIAHAEIDDVRPGVAGVRLGPVHLFEHVGRQAADAVEFFHCLGHRLGPSSRPAVTLFWQAWTPAGFYHGLLAAPALSLILSPRRRRAAPSPCRQPRLPASCGPFAAAFPARAAARRSAGPRRAAAAYRARPGSGRSPSAPRVSAGRPPTAAGSRSIIGAGEQPPSARIPPRTARPNLTRAFAMASLYPHRFKKVTKT